MRKNRVESSLANSTYSTSLFCSSEYSSLIAFLGIRVLFSPRDVELLAGLLDVRQAMAVGRHHGDRLRLQHHQPAIQGVTRLFAGNGEDGAADHAAQGLRWNLDASGCRKHRQPGKIRPRHSDHLGVRAAGADIDPMVFQQLDRDVAVGQQFHVVVQLAGRNGAGAFALHLRRARRAEAQVEIGGRDGQPVIGRFK